MKKIGVILTLLLLTGCLGAGFIPQYVMINGVVYHKNSNIPLNNAKVTIKIGDEKYVDITGNDGSFVLHKRTRFKNGYINIERGDYQVLEKKLKLTDFINSCGIEPFYLEPKQEYQEHAILSGHVDFALPKVTTFPDSIRPQSFYTPMVEPIVESQELIIYPLSYSQAIAEQLYEEFNAVGMRLRPELEMIILKFPEDYALEVALEDIRFHPQILEAYINYPVFAQGGPVIPNDPDYRKQWNIPAIYLPYAWDITTGDKNIRIAVIDSKVHPHEDLINNLGDGYDFIKTEATVVSQNKNKKLISHGTHVAGILGAVTNNGIGVAGTMWEVEIIPITVLRDNGRGNLDALVAGINKAVELDVDIINLSLGIDVDLEPLHKAILDAYNQGIIIVAAAGNKPPNMKYPAQYPEVIAVGATSINYEIPWYSAYNELELFAPGGDEDKEKLILSTDLTSTEILDQYDYNYAQGTSMAAPHVTGIIGLILAAHGTYYTPEEISDLLWQTGTIFNINNPEQRLVNAYAAITESYIQDTVVEFIGTTQGNTYYLTDIDELRHFYYFLPADEYLVKAHLDVDRNGVLNSGDWYYEETLNVQPNSNIEDFVIRMEVYNKNTPLYR